MASRFRSGFGRLLLLLHVAFAMQQQQQQQSLSSHLSSSPANFHRRIFLIRHEATDWNDQGKLQSGCADICLNEKGQHQAKQMTCELQAAGATFDLIASSHLQRACQTADALCCLLTTTTTTLTTGNDNVKDSMARRTFPGFREMDYGDHEGLPIKGPASTSQSLDIFNRYKDPMMQGDMDLEWPGGESLRQVEQRALQTLQELLETPRYDAAGTADPPKRIAIVAHAILNRLLLAATLRGDGKHFVDFPQDNCCINVIDQLPDGTFQAVVLNYNQHILLE